MNGLKKYLEQSGTTLAEVAALANYKSRSTAFRHATGETRIPADAALKYHRALGIPLCELRPDVWPPEQRTPQNDDPVEVDRSEDEKF